MSHKLSFPIPVCEKPDCPRKGQPLRWNTERRPTIRGTDRTTTINVFLCEQYGPQKTLHTHKVGPCGEQLEKLPGFAHYRFTDALTGGVIETERTQTERTISAQGIENIRIAQAKRWTAEERAKASPVMYERAKAMWADPAMNAVMVAANQAKAAHPEFGRKISEGKLRSFDKNPEKRLRVSEAVRAARLKEQKRMRELEASAKRKKPGAKQMPEYAEAYRLHQGKVSVGKIAIKLFKSDYDLDPEGTIDKIKKGIRRYKRTLKLK